MSTEIECNPCFIILLFNCEYKVSTFTFVVDVIFNLRTFSQVFLTGPRSAVGNVSGYRCEADCRSRGYEIDPGPVPYFRGD